MLATVGLHTVDGTTPEALALVRQAEEDFGIRLSCPAPVAGGEDVDAVVFKAATEDGGAVALKATRRSRPAGLLVAGHLAGLGVAGVPAPRQSRSGLPLSVRDGWQVSLVPWVDGGLAADVGMTPAQWRAYGELLAAVHSTPVPPDLRRHLPQEGHHTPEVLMADAVAARVAAWPLGTDTGVSDDDIEAAAIRLWSASADDLREVVRGARVLGNRLNALPRDDVLCHGDAHTLNVVAGADGTVWLLDWDEVVLAPRERDLMFVLGGVVATALVSAEEQAWFFEGYGLASPAEVDPVRLAYYRCSWAVQDVADFADRTLDLSRPSTERTHTLALLRSVLSPTGIVEQALASLREIGRDTAA